MKIEDKIEEKSDLRRKLLQIRREFKDDKSPKIVENFLQLPELEKSREIFAYAPTSDEVKIDPLLEKLLQLDKKISIPYIISKTEMVASRVFVLDELIQSKFGIRSTPTLNLVEPAEIDLIIVPGAGFDRRGNRLGLGAGFYDRFLQKIPRAVKIALAFQFQILDQIPTESHDQKIDVLVTSEGVIRF